MSLSPPVSLPIALPLAPPVALPARVGSVLAALVCCALLVAPVAAPAQEAAPPRVVDCIAGPGLGASLLFPYFEVDLDDPAGFTTLIAVNNGFTADALARVVLWTDWGVPTLAFDLHLPGFDVQTLNLRDVFAGRLPSTGDDSLDSYPLCDSLPPSYPQPALSPNQRAQLAAFHRGTAGPMDNRCAGSPQDDGRVRGYVTVDVVDQCSGLEPFLPTITPANADLPYFVDGGGEEGVATVDNVLWGDLLFVDEARDLARGVEAVALWADPDRFGASNIHTFYGRYSGWDGRDDRVPLPWRWDQRFLNGGSFDGGAELIVWRDNGSPVARPVACDEGPAWAPLNASLATLDEDADGLVTLPARTVPYLTQRVRVRELGIPYPFGWLQVDTRGAQSWVLATLTAGDRFSATWNGTPVEFLCDRPPIVGELPAAGRTDASRP